MVRKNLGNIHAVIPVQNIYFKGIFAEQIFITEVLIKSIYNK